MKAFVIILFSFIYFFSNAQYPISFIDSSNQWLSTFDYDGGCGNCHNYCHDKFFYKSDTVIEMNRYKQIYSDKNGYQGSVRQDSSSIIWYRGKYAACGGNVNGSAQTSDIILYNFNLKQGDSIINILDLQTSHSKNIIKVVVQKVDTIIIFGQKRRALSVQGRSFNGGIGDNDVWVEGIGSLKNPFYPLIFYSFEWTYHLDCFTNDVIKSIRDGKNYSCLSRIENVYFENNIQIFPNPVSNQVFISLNGNIAAGLKEVRILNVTGALVKTIPSIKQNTYQIDVDGLVNGIYFVRFSFADGQGVKKIVVNH